VDREVRPGTTYAYTVRALDRRGRQSKPSNVSQAAPLPEIKEPVFAATFAARAEAELLDGKLVPGRLHAGAKTVDGALELGSTGFASFDDLPEFDLPKTLSLECWVRIDRESQMPVIVSAGAYNSAGWFLQRYGRGWRWHLAPVNCDGGQPVVGRWTHLVGTFDGRRAHLYQDGKPVASVGCSPNRTPWNGPLVIGQYSRQQPSYQVQGAVAGVKIYHRALPPQEITEKFQAGRTR